MSNKTSRSVRASLTLAVLLLAGLGVSACNTVAGAGKDVSSVGHDVTNGAGSVKTSIQNGQ